MMMREKKPMVMDRLSRPVTLSKRIIKVLYIIDVASLRFNEYCRECDRGCLKVDWWSRMQ